MNERRPEIAAQSVRHEGQVLHPGRLVEAEALDGELPLGNARFRADQQLDRIADRIDREENGQ